MRRLAVGVFVIVLFTAAAVVGIWALTRDVGSPARRGVPEPPAAPPPPQALPGIPPVGSIPVAPQGIPAPVVYAPPPPEPPKGSWEAVAVVARPSALGPLGGAIGRGLAELQPRLSACFDEDTAARYGAKAHTVALDPSAADAGTPVLILEIETGADAALIVDAPVDARGNASDGVIACAQGVLRGQRFPYPQAQRGQKYRMMHPLIP